MNQKFLRNIKSRRGYFIFMISVTLVTLSLTMSISIYRSAFGEINRVKRNSEMLRSKYYAQSGLALGVLYIHEIPREYLIQLFGIPVSRNLDDVQLTFTVTEETGKLNLNTLVNFFNDEVNFSTREMFDRLGENFAIPMENWDAVIDWIDENSVRMPGGYEAADYEAMDPPRRIKNGRLHSVEELLFINGFDAYTLFVDGRTEEEKKMYSTEFLSEGEQFAVDESVDFIFANNVTVYLPENPVSDVWKININSAPYHVVLSLSAFMTPPVARKILAARWDAGGYFSKVEDLKVIPELSMPTTDGVTLYDEIKEKIVVTDRIYKIVVEAKSDTQTAHVLGIYDVASKQLVMYLE